MKTIEIARRVLAVAVVMVGVALLGTWLLLGTTKSLQLATWLIEVGQALAPAASVAASVWAALQAYRAWEATQKARAEAEAREAAEAARVAMRTGWWIKVMDGQTVLFHEELSVGEADQLLAEDCTAPARTGDARRIGQSACTSKGFVNAATYDIASVDSAARVYAIHVDRDPGCSPKKPAAPKA